MRAELDAKVLALIREGVDALPDDARFGALALELFRYQYEHNAPYRRLCDAEQRSPDAVNAWTDIPAVPTGAFKEARLASFPESDTVAVFRTSGSTTDARGELHLDTLALYEASLRETFDAFICTGSRPRFAVLAPPFRSAPDSSLSYMFDVAVREFGAEGSRFYVLSSGWDPAALIADLLAVREPLALVGTAFAFVHLLDSLAAVDAKLELPAGSRVMETGGFKGRSRELSREELHGGIARVFGITHDRIVNQYGMCELGSQFYEDSLVTGVATTTKRVPPWVRTRVVDPDTLVDVPPGETGVLVHYDLANTGSVLAVLTSDAGRISDGGFEVLGRIEGAEARGCSIAADTLLAQQS
jgi:acyl-CoA synthetase (AMP-forming)/AMP-acid ligase II